MPTEFQFIDYDEEVGIDVENIKSRKLFERLGFRRKGVHPDGGFEYYEKSLAQTPS